MLLTTSELRRLTAARDAGDRSGCPPAERLVAVAGGERSTPLTAHLAVCAACSGELRAALALREELGLPDKAASASRGAGGLLPFIPPRASHRRAAWTVLLATAACAVIALVGLSSLNGPDRGGDSPAAHAVRGAEGLFSSPSPADGGHLDAAPASLSLAVERARIAPQASFTVAIFDPEANRLWESAPEPRAEFTLPEQARSLLRPGVAYGWRVFVRDRVETWQSPLYRFEIRP